MGWPWFVITEDLMPEQRLMLPLYYLSMNLLNINTFPTISLPNSCFHLHRLALMVILASGSANTTSFRVIAFQSFWKVVSSLTLTTQATTSNSWFRMRFSYTLPKVTAESSDFTMMFTSETQLNWDFESNMMVQGEILSFLLLLQFPSLSLPLEIQYIDPYFKQSLKSTAAQWKNVPIIFFFDLSTNSISKIFVPFLELYLKTLLVIRHKIVQRVSPMCRSSIDQYSESLPVIGLVAVGIQALISLFLVQVLMTFSKVNQRVDLTSSPFSFNDAHSRGVPNFCGYLVRNFKLVTPMLFFRFPWDLMQTIENSSLPGLTTTSSLRMALVKYSPSETEHMTLPFLVVAMSKTCTIIFSSSASASNILEMPSADSFEG